VLAHRAVSSCSDVGVHLPCNVVVTVTPEGVTEVAMVNPEEFGTRVPELKVVADDVYGRLSHALAGLPH
jgi:uncharacterized protein (DUF302 family)